MKSSIVIHTIIYNEYNLYDKITGLENILYWKEIEIIDIIKKKYSNFFKFYCSLLLNKSRENFAKYIIINEFGGLFININILINLTKYDIIKIQEILYGPYDCILYKNQYQDKIILDIFKIDDILLNDDIFFFRYNNNKIIQELLKNININIIPINEYQNKLLLGNIFLSQCIYKFMIYNKHNIKIKKKIFVSNYFLNKVYSNIPELKNPEIILESWNTYYNIIILLRNILIIFILNIKNWKKSLILFLLVSCIESLIINQFENMINVSLLQAKNDNFIFYNHKKYKIFREIHKNWHYIHLEALNMLENAPKLKIINNDNNYDKYGWTKINNNVFNFDFYNNNKEYTENIINCPDTIKYISKFKDKINICRFEYYLGNTIIKSKNNYKSDNNLILHLGLIIPKPNDSCKLVIKNNSNEYIYKSEKEGQIIIYNNDYENYSYNLSNRDRIILYISFIVI